MLVLSRTESIKQVKVGSVNCEALFASCIPKVGTLLHGKCQFIYTTRWGNQVGGSFQYAAI